MSPPRTRTGTLPLGGHRLLPHPAVQPGADKAATEEGTGEGRRSWSVLTQSGGLWRQRDTRHPGPVDDVHTTGVVWQGSGTMTVSVGLDEAICFAVATAAGEDDAPLSAWPERFPGRWATAARVAELVGRSPAEARYVLVEVVKRGDIVAERPWPGDLRGYRPSPSWVAPQHAPGVPDPVHDRRQWMLDALSRWAELHDGLAPARADWSQSRDPGRKWPRADQVAAFFEAEAEERGERRFVPERCDGCSCRSGRHYRNEEGREICDGCFDCRGCCPHGDAGEWVGPSGWQYALQLAQLEVRTGGDHHATAAQTLGRNRQMVTGGVADQFPQHFQR